jgi:hypothetical protein
MLWIHIVAARAHQTPGQRAEDNGQFIYSPPIGTFVVPDIYFAAICDSLPHDAKFFS